MIATVVSVIKKGYLWNFPGPDCFGIERGEDKLTGYDFGKKSMVHKVGLNH